MGLPFFYLDKSEIDTVKGRAYVTGRNYIHLSKSLRVKKDESVTICDGCGMIMESRVDRHRKGCIELEIMEERLSERERPLVCLFQGMSKPRAMDEAVSRAAEAGVAVLVPVLTGRSSRPSPESLSKRLDRWRRIAVESSMVARRPWVLQVSPPTDIDGASLLRRGEIGVFCWEEERARGLKEVLPAIPPESIHVLIGPEGGLGNEDVQKLTSAGWNSAHLGDLVFKSSSAGSYAALLIRYHYGLLGKRRSGQW